MEILLGVVVERLLCITESPWFLITQIITVFVSHTQLFAFCTHLATDFWLSNHIHWYQTNQMSAEESPWQQFHHLHRTTMPAAVAKAHHTHVHAST